MLSLILCTNCNWFAHWFNCLKKDTTTISFLSLSIAYTIGLLFFAISESISNGRADDFGVIIFWSALFEFVAWAVFLVYPLKKLNLNSSLFNPIIFPFITTIYFLAVFTLIIGWAFFVGQYDIVFGVDAVVGYSFGLIYVILIKSEGFNRFIHASTFNRLIILYPFVFLFCFLWIFPRVTPSLAFRFMPDEIQSRIVGETIPKFKVGDDFKDLQKSLPGYFDFIENGGGNHFAQSEGFSFVIQIKNDKIIRLEHSNQENPDFSIYPK